MESLGTVEAESIVDLLQADDAAGLPHSLNATPAAEKNRGPAAVCDRLIGRVCETLSIQRLAEEEVLYPAIRASDDKLVFAFLLAGLGISMRIGEIRDPANPPTTREFSVLRLKELVRRNLLERTQILFPFVRSRLSQTQMIWLGDDYQERKARLRALADATPPRVRRRARLRRSCRGASARSARKRVRARQCPIQENYPWFRSHGCFGWSPDALRASAIGPRCSRAGSIRPGDGRPVRQRGREGRAPARAPRRACRHPRIDFTRRGAAQRLRCLAQSHRPRGRNRSRSRGRQGGAKRHAPGRHRRKRPPSI